MVTRNHLCVEHAGRFVVACYAASTQFVALTSEPFPECSFLDDHSIQTRRAHDEIVGAMVGFAGDRNLALDGDGLEIVATRLKLLKDVPQAGAHDKWPDIPAKDRRHRVAAALAHDQRPGNGPTHLSVQWTRRNGRHHLVANLRLEILADTAS